VYNDGIHRGKQETMFTPQPRERTEQSADDAIAPSGEELASTEEDPFRYNIKYGHPDQPETD
jgi:hypothetical protein